MNLDLLATEIVTRLEQTHEDRLNRVELVKGLILQEMARINCRHIFNHEICIFCGIYAPKSTESALDWGKPTHYFDE